MITANNLLAWNVMVYLLFSTKFGETSSPILKLSPHTVRNIRRIAPFVVIWLIAGLIYTLLEKGLLGDLKYYPSTGNPYDFKSASSIVLLLVAVMGSMVGAFEVVYLSNRFEKRSLLFKIAVKMTIYLVIIIGFLVISAAISNTMELQNGLPDPRVWENVWSFVTNFAFWSVVLFVAAVLWISLFLQKSV